MSRIEPVFSRRKTVPDPAAKDREYDMNRKLIWGIPIALVILGLTIMLISTVQPFCMATVTEKGPVNYTPAVKSARTRRSARYSVTLEVTYLNDQGENSQAQVQWIALHSQDIPEIGDQIAICHGLKGMVPHPNRNLLALGRTSAALGGFFLVVFLLTRWSLRREQRRAQVSAPNGTPSAEKEDKPERKRVSWKH